MSAGIDTAAAVAFSKQRGHLPWSKLYGDQWLSIYGSGVSVKAKLLWVSLQDILNQSGGYLSEENSQISISDLSLRLNISEKKLQSLIEELLRISALCKDDNGNVYDPRMVLDKGSTAWETERKKVRNNRENGGNPTSFPPVSRNTRARDQEKEKEPEKEKEKDKKKARKLAGEIDSLALPLFLDNQEFRKALQDWKEHKQLKRDPLTQRALELIVSDCEKWGLDKSIEYIHHAIKKGWKGIFETIQPATAPAASPKPKPEPDNWRGILRKLYPNERDLQVAVCGFTIPETFKQLPESVQREVKDWIKQNG